MVVLASSLYLAHEWRECGAQKAASVPGSAAAQQEREERLAQQRAAAHATGIGSNWRLAVRNKGLMRTVLHLAQARSGADLREAFPTQKKRVYAMHSRSAFVRRNASSSSESSDLD